VQEGSVRVEAKQTSELTATQSVAYDQNGEFVSIPTRQSVDSITAWRRGKLILDNRRLDEVLLEIGRYHNVQLRLSDVMLP
jgi:transmembrane sensor